MRQLIVLGYENTYESGWTAFALGLGVTHGVWPDYDAGWLAHLSEGV